MCPQCESPGIEIRGKLVCPFCRIILETCCEGGRCTYAEQPPTQISKQDDAHERI